MRRPEINGEGELRGQPANLGSPGKMAVKTVCVCVCVCVFVCVHACMRACVCVLNASVVDVDSDDGDDDDDYDYDDYVSFMHLKCLCGHLSLYCRTCVISLRR